MGQQNDLRPIAQLGIGGRLENSSSRPTSASDNEMRIIGRPQDDSKYISHCKCD